VSEHSSGKTNTRVGIILFLAIYICLFLLCAITFKDFGIMARSQRRIFVCVILALPLIAVRLLYSLIGGFDNSTNNQFSIVTGSPAIQLAMATIEEILVVLMFAILGVITPRADRAPAPAYDDQYEQNNMGYVQNPHYVPSNVDYAGQAARTAYNAGRYNEAASNGTTYNARNSH
jgi:hypothetical protein